MKHTAVKSSNLASVGYDPSTRKLQVKFQSGTTHEYDGVPAAHHAALLKAKSPGGYFFKHIKDGGFKSRQVS